MPLPFYGDSCWSLQGMQRGRRRARARATVIDLAQLFATAVGNLQALCRSLVQGVQRGRGRARGRAAAGGERAAPAGRADGTAGGARERPGAARAAAAAAAAAARPAAAARVRQIRHSADAAVLPALHSVYANLSTISSCLK